MYRRAHRAVQKTEVWLHRSIGSDNIKIPYYGGANMRRIRACGNSDFDTETYDEIGKVSSAPEGEPHFIKVRLGGRNLLNYNLLGNAMKTKIPETKFLVTAKQITMFSSTDFAHPVIESDFVKFKKYRQYSFAACVSYASGKGERPTGFYFAYTDGTVEEIRINATATTFNYFVAVSRPGKSLSAIGVMRPVGQAKIYYYVDKFGVYEGDLSSEVKITDPYYEPQIANIELSAPLRGIYGSSDILEFTEGICQRNIEYVRFDSSDGLEPTDAPCVFSARLPALMRDDLAYECPFGVSDGSEEMENYDWIEICEDRHSILLHLTGCPTLSDADARLRQKSFAIAYVMQTPYTEHFSLDFDSTENEAWLSLELDFAPYLFYAEYI